MKLTSQILSPTCLMPTFWPAKTWLRLIFRRSKQMRPQRVTVTVVVERIVEFGQPAVGTRRRAVELGGVAHVERLVRTLAVVAVDEVVELGLLLQEVVRRRSGGFHLQGQVHALVAAVLLRVDRA